MMCIVSVVFVVVACSDYYVSLDRDGGREGEENVKTS